MRSRDDTRRFRELYLEVPRKNGKSLLAATLGLYMLTEDGEGGAEVYSGATTEAQAWEVFKPARLMALGADGFAGHYGLNINASNISSTDGGSKFHPIIGTPGDGASPSCAIVDEMHEHKTSELYDTMITGQGARQAPLMVIVTTAGSDIAGPCYQKRDEVCSMLEKTPGFENEELFGIIYTLDKGDDWTDFETWKKANPNYGVSIYSDFLKARLKEAIRSSNRQNVNKRKHLNIWDNAACAWMNMEYWDRQADKSLSIDDFEGEQCWIGMDLASKIDITAVVMVFKREDRYYAFAKHYLPESAVEGADKSHYQKWQHEGLLEVTAGNMTDYAYIEEDILDICKRFDVIDLAFDPYNASYLVTRLMKAGLEDQLIEVGATVANFSDPMKFVEALTYEGKLFHNDDPVLTWEMSNVTAFLDRKDNIFPRKEKPEKKIDGVVALIMALSRAMIGVESSYADGLEVAVI